MAKLHDQLVDLVEQGWCEQADVVFERLQMGVGIADNTVAQHGANVAVFVDQLVQTVVVHVQVQPDDAAHQDVPQGHAGASVALVDLGCNLALKQREDRRPQGSIHVQLLQTPQDFRNVVA